MALLALARSAEIFLDQLVDDLPLRAVGVLGFVDQHMVDLAIELVTHPVAHARLLQQVPRPVDQVVEVGDAGSALGAGIGGGEGLARAQPGGDVGGEPGAVLTAQQLPDQHRQAPRMRFVMRLRLASGRSKP